MTTGEGHHGGQHRSHSGTWRTTGAAGIKALKLFNRRRSSGNIPLQPAIIISLRPMAKDQVTNRTARLKNVNNGKEATVNRALDGSTHPS